MSELDRFWFSGEPSFLPPPVFCLFFLTRRNNYTVKMTKSVSPDFCGRMRQHRTMYCLRSLQRNGTAGNHGATCGNGFGLQEGARLKPVMKNKTRGFRKQFKKKKNPPLYFNYPELKTAVMRAATRDWRALNETKTKHGHAGGKVCLHCTKQPG